LRVLLDTTALSVAGGVSDLAFTPKVQHLLLAPDTVRLVSSISSVEIAITANWGLVAFTRKHLESLVFDLNLTVLPMSAEHSMGLLGLPAHHQDPFDRPLIAIALAESVPLVAKDREFKKYKGLRTIW